MMRWWLTNQVATGPADEDAVLRAGIADLLGVDRERIRLWTFARAAAEPHDDWRHDDSMALARAIAP
jgi:hypothetical protein